MKFINRYLIAMFIFFLVAFVASIYIKSAWSVVLSFVAFVNTGIMYMMSHDMQDRIHYQDLSINTLYDDCKALRCAQLELEEKNDNLRKRVNQLHQINTELKKKRR